MFVDDVKIYIVHKNDNKTNILENALNSFILLAEKWKLKVAP